MATPLELESLVLRITADTNQFMSRTRDIMKQMDVLHQKFKDFSVTIPRLLAIALSTVTLQSSIRWFTQLDESLTRILMHTRDWAAQNRALLQSGVFGLARQSIFDPASLAVGLDALASSGMNAAMSVRALGIAEQFALAGNMPIQDATRKLTDLQRALGMQSADVEIHLQTMSHIGDLFAGIANQTGSSVNDLMNSFGPRFLGAMKASKIGLEDAVVLMGAFSEQMVRSGRASDTASRFLNVLNKNATDNWMTYEILGVKVLDTTNKFRKMSDIVADLSKLYGGMSPGQLAAVEARMGFETRSLAGLQPLFGLEKEMRRLEAETKNVHGVMEKMATMMRESFVGQMKNVWNNIKLTAIAIGDSLAPALLMVTTPINNLLKAFTSLNPAIRNLIVFGTMLYFSWQPLTRLLMWIGSYAISPFRVLGGLVWNLVKGFWALAFGALQATYSVLLAIFTFWVNNILLIVQVMGLLPLLILGAVAAASVFATVIISTWQGLKIIGASLQALWQDIPNLFRRAGEGLNELGLSTLRMWDDSKEGVKDFIDRAVAGIKIIAGFFWHFRHNMSEIFDFVKENWSDVTEDMGSMFRTVIENLIKNIKELASVIWDSIGTVAGGIGSIFYRIGDSIRFLLKDQGQNIIDDLGTVFNAFFESLKHNFTIIATIIGRILEDRIRTGLFGGKSRYDLLLEDLKKQYDKELLRIARMPVGNERVTELARVMARNEEGKQEVFRRTYSHGLGPLKGMGDFLSRGDFKTSGRAFGSEWRRLFGEEGVSGRIALDLKDIGKALAKRFETLGLTPLLEGFVGKAPWDKLADRLKTELPPDVFDQIAGWFRQPTSRLGEEGPFGNLFTGKGGPGFAFKQISLERTMLGGAAAESLDYQQLVTLKSIDKNVAEILRARNLNPADFARIPGMKLAE